MPSNRNSLNEYKARVMLAINFINENLSEKITLGDISRAAFFSPFHFHRIFTGIVGETPVDFLNRVRLEKAANMLTTSLSITQIAIKTGFSSSTVFSRAFKKHFGCPASEWREKSCLPEFSKKSKVKSKKGRKYDFAGNYFDSTDFGKNNSGRSKMKVEIKNLPARHLAYAPQLDGYDDAKIAAVWEKLCNWGYSQNLINEETTLIGISFDNPCVTPADKCRYYACISVAEDVKPPKGMGLFDMPAGKYAVSRYVGKGDDIGKAWSDLFGRWLPSSGFEPTDAPCHDIYYETPETNKEGNFVMDLCIPVKAML